MRETSVCDREDSSIPMILPFVNMSNWRLCALIHLVLWLTTFLRSAVARNLCGRGSQVVWVSDHGLPCHEFEPSTTKDPPSEDVGLSELIYGTEKETRYSNPQKNIALTAKEIESSSSPNKISESHTSKLETMNEIKIKQEENLDAEEEKLQQPITIIKNDIRFENLQTFFQKYNL
ncbi:hypothetical protein TNCV_1679851 [Trichonephila clavipes]|nr:hypothetical protein TNCV_1679851 [Trichonephila clavipes]